MELAHVRLLSMGEYTVELSWDRLLGTVWHRNAIDLSGKRHFRSNILDIADIGNPILELRIGGQNSMSFNGNGFPDRRLAGLEQSVGFSHASLIAEVPLLSLPFGKGWGPGQVKARVRRSIDSGLSFASFLIASGTSTSTLASWHLENEHQFTSFLLIGLWKMNS